MRGDNGALTRLQVERAPPQGTLREESVSPFLDFRSIKKDLP